MGILVSGLIGQVRNKVGNMVFSNWKGINTARAYAVPANPQSIGQTAQRTKFAAVVSLAQNLLGTLITTFVNPFAVKMSGFNMFISMFIANATSTGLATALCQVTKGTLEGYIVDAQVAYSTMSGGLDLSWSAATTGNGLSTDQLNVLALNITDNSIVGYFPNAATRAIGSGSVTGKAGLVAANIVVYAWFSRGTGSDFIVSNSFGQIAGAA